VFLVFLLYTCLYFCARLCCYLFFVILCQVNWLVGSLAVQLWRLTGFIVSGYVAVGFVWFYWWNQLTFNFCTILARLSSPYMTCYVKGRAFFYMEIKAETQFKSRFSCDKKRHQSGCSCHIVAMTFTESLDILFHARRGTMVEKKNMHSWCRLDTHYRRRAYGL
jgi:hypothetical protein